MQRDRMLPARDASIELSEPQPQLQQRDATEWSAWERWLKGHLDNALA